jgi:hypothetical protein
MGATVTGVVLSGQERRQLERWARQPTAAARLVRRSRIVLLAAEGLPPGEIGRRVGVSAPTVRLWLRRFGRGGPEALVHDAPRRGRPPRLDAEALERLRGIASGSDGPTSISVRAAAAALGISPSSVWRGFNRLRTAAAAEPAAAVDTKGGEGERKDTPPGQRERA